MKVYPLTYSPARNYRMTGIKNQNHNAEMKNLQSEPSFKSWGNALTGGVTGVAMGAAGVVLMWMPILGNKVCNTIKGKI